LLLKMKMNRTEQLHERIGRLRDEARGAGNASTATSGREQVDVVDGAIRLAAHLTEQGKTGAERWQVLSGVQVGSTVTPNRVAKTVLSPQEKLDKTLAWARGLTEDQRNEFMASEKFDALTDRQAELVGEAFGQLDSEAYDASVGISSDDFNCDASSVDINQLPEDETESVGDSFEVEEGEDVASFGADPWEGDVV
jgi:hypothetical protein